MRYKKLIEIDIDLLTQCLIRTKDNKIVKTEVKEINTQHYNFKDWEFNWVEESKKRNKILGLFDENDNLISEEVFKKLSLFDKNGVPFSYKTMKNLKIKEIGE